MEPLFSLIAVALLVYFFKDSLREKFLPKKQKYYTIDDQFNSEKKDREAEIDRILSKIGKNGLEDLSPKDRNRLDELSKK